MHRLMFRRLRYLLAGVFFFFLLFALLRAGFYIWSSEVTLGEGTHAAEVLKTLGVGLRFDLRLAILLMLPLAILAILPRFNLATSRPLRWLGRLWLLAAALAVTLVYIVDFGHYQYLGLRINSSILRFFADAQISADMVWQSYPVVWLTLLWLAASALIFGIMLALEKRTLDRQPRQAGVLPVALAVAATVVLGFLGILGRLEDINPRNPVPLRWGDAFFSGSTQVGALGLNPVIFLWDTVRTPLERYDMAAVREYYPEVSNYLGLEGAAAGSAEAQPRFDRHIGVQPYHLQRERAPNVVFIMLESFGSSVTGIHGNPLDPTPHLDSLARQGWFFPNLYVPVTGTAKTVWATVTGIPDVSRAESATRNPFIVPQHTVANAFRAHDKFYAIGGSAGWANMNALIVSSVDGIKLYEEGHWKSKNADVWGVSDLNMFKEVDAMLRDMPRDKPFFAFLQTAGNHRPFTIPPDSDDFEVKRISDAEADPAGFRSADQYNAVRLQDYSVGRFIEMAKKSGYHDDTIFVLYGDHNGRISQLPFMPPAYEALNLESLNVPAVIYAPKMIAPRVTAEATSLLDLLPTVAGLVGVEYTNTTMGRDIQLPAPEGERAVPVVLREGNFPLIGVVTQHYLVQMNADGSSASMHEIASKTPLDNVAEANPAEYQRLYRLARGLHETARLMLYSNKVEDSSQAVPVHSPLPDAAPHGAH